MKPLPQHHGSVHDFDFLPGRWRVHNRRLATRLRGADDWHEFEARSHCRQLLGGLVNIDENHFPSEGFSGLSLRLFDPARRQWSIYWVNSRSGRLLPPVHGGFDGQRGEFYGLDVDEGREVAARFVWTRQGDDAARWEQAFSLDGEAWEVNWVMQLTRTASADAATP